MSSAAPGALGLIAHFRGDEKLADAQLARARTQAGHSEPDRAIIEYFTAWRAASRGDAELSGRHASVCVDLGRSLSSPLYGPMGRVLCGWSAALMGDPQGAATADAAYDDDLVAGARIYLPVYWCCVRRPMPGTETRNWPVSS